MDRIVRDVPPDQVAFARSLLESDGFTVREERQADGRITLIGTQAAAAPSARLALGPNERFRAAILLAAERCRMDPAALAALIDAEAGKAADGAWDPRSANPRSSACGLTQFLAATWREMACRPGTHLCERARGLGLVGDDGRAVAAREAELLELRFDPELSIVAAAEYAAANLKRLAGAGCLAETAGDDERARLAYLAHHEGAQGAIDFLRDAIDEARAETLLERNAGREKAAALKAEAGSCRAAYKAFLSAYIEQKIRPERFRA